jgi:hypothetical protein
MRRFTLLISALLLCSLTYGQVASQGIPVPFKDEAVRNQPVVHNDLKAGGDVFWSTTFDWGNPETLESSVPEGWVIADLSDLGNYWMWRSPYDTLGGCCTWQGPSSNFATPMDGYLVVPADEYNRRDGVGTSNGMNTYIISPPINCSSKTSVTVKFKQLFRLCCGTTEMFMSVTNDNGVHWATYDCRFGLPNNRVSDLRYQDVEFNITDVAAGMANVQIKFSMSGNSHYFWMIDDLQLTEAFQSDLVLADYWADVNGGYDEGVGHINYWPMTQLGSASPVAGNIGEYSFRGAFLNNGMVDQEDAKLEMTVTRGGEQVFQDFSSTSTIWPLERDTMTVNSVFLADEYGDYRFNFKAVSDNIEEVPANNSVSLGFTVNDTLYHRADFTPEAGSNTGGWVGGSNAGDMVGVFYDIYEPVEINSITAYIYGVTISEVPQFQYVLQKEIEGELVEISTSDVVDATLEQRGTFVSLDLLKDGETEFLEPGSYLACVRFWGTKEGDADGTNGMSIGWDMDNNQNNYTYNYQSVGGAWFNTGKVNMIGLGLNTVGGPRATSVTFNVDLSKQIASGEFMPATDVVEVIGISSVWEGRQTMTDADADGIYSVTVDNLSISGTMGYKYGINGIDEYSPLTTTRKYKIGYANNLKDSYNGGRPIIVFNVDMTEAIASGKFVPGTDTLRVEGLGNSWQRKAELTDEDGDGIYTRALQNVNFAAVLNYKYSINSELETFTATNDPHRVWTVKYWNTVNDKFEVVTSGLDLNSLISNFSVYPNPSSGAFNLIVSSTAPSDLVISLTNIQGQVVYRNTVANVTTHQETIGSNLSKGLYFLSINNGSEVKVQKVVIQ